MTTIPVTADCHHLCISHLAIPRTGFVVLFRFSSGPAAFRRCFRFISRHLCNFTLYVPFLVPELEQRTMYTRHRAETCLSLQQMQGVNRWIRATAEPANNFLL